MARLITYGCETGDPHPPNGESGGIAIVGTDPNSGTKHYEVDAADSTASAHRANWTALGGVNNRVYFLRFYFKKSGNPSSVVNLCTFGSLANGHYGELQLQIDGKLKLRRNGSVDVGTSAALDNGYHYLELRIKLGTATNNGQIEGRIDGEAFAVNNATNLGTVSAPDELRVGVTNSTGGTGGQTLRWDDIALNDDQGAEDNSWPGALEVNEPPVVVTGEVKDIGGATATPTGTVNPKGLSTAWWFELTPKGKAEWAEVGVGDDGGDGEESVPVEEDLGGTDGLEPETEYEVRLVAENAIGKSTGEAVGFKTGEGPSETPVSVTFVADHEGAELLGEYGGSSTFQGTLTKQTPGYDGGNAIKAATTEPDGYARGHAQKAETGWKSGEEVRWGGAIYLPTGFFAAKQGQIDLLRWDNFEQDEVTTDRCGVVFQTGDKKFRLVRIKEGEPDEQHTFNLDEAEAVIGPEIEEGRWYWVEVRQVLWHEDALAVNELWIDGVKVAESSARNCAREDLIVSRYRVGIAATNGAQTNDLSVYVDRIRSGPMPLIGPLEVAEPPTAITGAATGITFVTATLNGTVDPNNAATTYYFEYGTTEAYGTKVPASEDASAGEGAEALAVDASISGLASNTTYHFRLVAVNAEGESKGIDRAFKTAFIASNVPTGPTWTYILTQLDGTEVGEVRQAVERKVIMSLNKPSTAAFTIRPDNPLLVDLFSDDTLLKVYEDTTLRFHGNVVSSELSTQEDGSQPTVKVNAADPAWKLSRRISGLSAGGTKYEGDKAKSARKIINELNAQLGHETNPHTGIKLLAESEYSAGGSGTYVAGPYKASLACINDLANGFDGFDWYMNPLEGETAVVSKWTTTLLATYEAKPTIGGSSNAVFEHGYGQHNVRKLSYLRDLAGLVNKAYHLPDEGFTEGATVKEAADVPSLEHRGHYEAVADGYGLTDATLRQNWVDEVVRVRKNPRFVVAMTLDIDDGTGRVPQLGTDFWLGDLVHARSVIADATMFNGQVRVYQIQVELNDAGTATVTPVLLDEEGGEL